MSESFKSEKFPFSSLIFHGNARKILPKLPNNHYRCLLTDPPYGIGYVSDWNNGKNAVSIEGDEGGAHKLLEEVLQLAKPKLKANAAVYVFTSWKTLPKTIKAVEKHFKVKNLLVWVKDSWSMGDLRNSYANQYELIIYAVKGKPKLAPPRSPDVLNFPRVPPMKRLHPAQKPVELLEFLIKKSTQEGETVLDPFSGSGSTAIACLNARRSFTCIESSLRYFTISVERVVNYLRGGNG